MVPALAEGHFKWVLPNVMWRWASQTHRRHVRTFWRAQKRKLSDIRQTTFAPIYRRRSWSQCLPNFAGIKNIVGESLKRLQ